MELNEVPGYGMSKMFLNKVFGGELAVAVLIYILSYSWERVFTNSNLQTLISDINSV